jgi:hypothetical protein
LLPIEFGFGGLICHDSLLSVLNCLSANTIAFS